MLSLCNDLDYMFHVFVDRPARPILLTNSSIPFDHLQAVQAALGHTTQLQPGAARFNADIVLATLQTDDSVGTQQSQQPAAPTPSPPSQRATPDGRVPPQNFDSLASDLTTPPAPPPRSQQQQQQQQQQARPGSKCR